MKVKIDWNKKRKTRSGPLANINNHEADVNNQEIKLNYASRAQVIRVLIMLSGSSYQSCTLYEYIS